MNCLFIYYNIFKNIIYNTYCKYFNIIEYKQKNIFGDENINNIVNKNDIENCWGHYVYLD